VAVAVLVIWVVAVLLSGPLFQAQEAHMEEEAAVPGRISQLVVPGPLE
jgi:hypothetical protein